MPARSRSWLAAFRIVVLLGATFFLYALMRLRQLGRRGEVRLRISGSWGHRWGRWAQHILGYRLTQRGPRPLPGAYLAPNHTTYMDIFALNALLPCFFVPKADIAAWPVVGTMARNVGHVYIDRANKRALINAAGQIRDRLLAHQTVLVFLEGTSSGGPGVLPFKPSLLQPALETGAPIVPVRIKWSVDAGKNAGEIDLADEVAYWKPEHVIGAHAWHLLGLRGLACEVVFGDPIRFDPQHPPDRRELADALHATVEHLA